MLIDTENHIENLIKQLEIIKTYYPDLNRLIEGANQAICASKNRASFPEINTANRARASIAGSVSSVLNAISHDEEPGRYVQRLMLNIVDICNDLLENIDIEATKFEAPVGLDGWKAKRNKFLVKRTRPADNFIIVFKPHLPGGDWVLHYKKTQIAYAETPHELVKLSEKFARMVAEATAPPPMPSTALLETLTEPSFMASRTL